MSDTSVVFNVLARDRASKVFRQIKNAAQDTSNIMRLAFGPAIMPVMASATAGVVGLGAAMAGAGVAAGVFGAVMGSAFTEVKEASDKTQDLQDKIRLLEQQIKVANATGIGDAGKLEKAKARATNELLARYAQLPPATRQTVIAYDNMKSSWQSFVDANKPAAYGIMTGGFTLITQVVGKLQPLFDVGAQAARRLLDGLTAAAGGGGIDRLVAWLTANAGPALDNLITIGRNLGTVIGQMFANFDSTGQGILSWLAEVTTRWAEWATQTEGGGLQAFVANVNSQGPGVVDLLSSLASAATAIATAVTPLAPVSLAVAQALAAIIAAVPPGVITAVVAAFVAYGVAMRAYAAYTTAAGIATKIWTGIQWVMNLALWSSPITWIVIAIVALIAVIVLIATKTDWFQTAWKVAWGGIKAAALAVGRWFRDVLWKQWIVGAWNGIKTAAVNVWNWMKELPGKLKSAFFKVTGFLTAPFRAAFNKVAELWNGTIGRLSWSVPSWVPGVGGRSISAPQLPYLDVGGTILRSGLAVVHKGEAVIPAKTAPLAAGAARQPRAQRLVLDVRGEREIAAMIKRMIRSADLLEA